MKVGPSQHGSFGIPPQLQEAAARARKEPEVSHEAKEEEQPADAPVKDDKEATDPRSMLAKVGVEFSDDDFQHYLFKGFLEKEIEVIKGPRPFKATFRTLCGGEYDEVDELLAQEVQEMAMTQGGFETRQSMWVLSYGITHLDGKPIPKKPVLGKDGKINNKETARKRREILNKIAGGVVNRLIQVHGILTVAMNMMVADPDKYLKNS